ncbi:hypothetical protein [Nitrobacter sp. JJSN]|uniref:hypothetical protein n=1 Tax=Nitrobacter sp. JJSN TaxID=3453033 RepID=UPI003F775655
MVAAVVTTDSVLLRAILSVPMVLLVPGHTVLRAIGVKTTSLPEHVAYAVGASLAAAIAGGFALNTIGFLTPLGWAIWLLAVTIGTSLVTARLRENYDLPPWPRPTGLRFRHGAAFALAVLITTGAYALAIRDESNQQQFKYVELWMLPPANAGPARLAVGVRSAEAQTQRFDLEITLNGQPLAIFRSLTLTPGNTWTREIPLPVVATTQKAEARLYRPEDNRLYRSVSALVPGS